MEMNIAPSPLSSPVMDPASFLSLVILAPLVYPLVLALLVRVHQCAHRESSVPLPIVNPPPWKLMTQGRRLELELEVERSERELEEREVEEGDGW
jgi:hypothetical protein